MSKKFILFLQLVKLYKLTKLLLLFFFYLMIKQLKLQNILFVSKYNLNFFFLVFILK